MTWFQRSTEFAGTDMLVPVVVVNNLSSETASRVDACAIDGNGRQMNHEDGKPDRQWS